MTTTTKKKKQFLWQVDVKKNLVFCKMRIYNGRKNNIRFFFSFAKHRDLCVH